MGYKLLSIDNGSRSLYEISIDGNNPTLIGSSGSLGDPDISWNALGVFEGRVYANDGNTIHEINPYTGASSRSWDFGSQFTALYAMCGRPNHGLYAIDSSDRLLSINLDTTTATALHTLVPSSSAWVWPCMAWHDGSGTHSHGESFYAITYNEDTLQRTLYKINQTTYASTAISNLGTRNIHGMTSFSVAGEYSNLLLLTNLTDKSLYSFNLNNNSLTQIGSDNSFGSDRIFLNIAQAYVVESGNIPTKIDERCRAVITIGETSANADIIYSTRSGETAGSIVSGDLNLDFPDSADDHVVDRIRWNSAEQINLNESDPPAMSSIFGDGKNYTIYFSDVLLSEFECPVYDDDNNVLVFAGNGFARFHLAGTDFVESGNNFRAGDRLEIVSALRSGVAISIHGKLTTPNPDFNAELTVENVPVTNITIKGKISAPTPDFDAQLTIQNVSASSIAIYGKLDVPSPDFDTQIEVVDAGVLLLSDWNGANINEVALALIASGGNGSTTNVTLYASPPRGSIGTLISGSDITLSNAAITRIRRRSSNTRLDIAHDTSGFDLSDYFGTGGAGRDLRIYIQSTATDVSSVAASSSLANSSSNRANFTFSSAMNTVLNGISTGDRFIIAFGFPVTAQTLEGKLTTPNPDFDAQLTVENVASDAITVHGKLTTPNPDFDAQLTIEDVPAGAVTVHGKLTTPNPDFDAQLTIEDVPAGAVTVRGKLTTPNPDFDAELTTIDIVSVYGDLSIPTPTFDTEVVVDESTALSLNDWDGNSINEVVLALIQSGGSGSVDNSTLYASGSRGDVGTLISGSDITLGSGDGYAITRIRRTGQGPSILINDDDDELVLSTYFGVGGPGRDLHIYVQTNETNVQSISVADAIGSVGGGYANFNLGSDIDALLDAIEVGDRFIIAFGFPVTAQTLEGKLTTPNPDFDAQVSLSNVVASAITVHGKLTTPNPDFTAEPFVIDISFVHSKLTTPNPDFDAQLTIEDVPADAITVHGELTTPNPDFGAELTVKDVVAVYGKLTTPTPTFDTEAAVDESTALSLSDWDGTSVNEVVLGLIVSGADGSETGAVLYATAPRGNSGTLVSGSDLAFGDNNEYEITQLLRAGSNNTNLRINDDDAVFVLSTYFGSQGDGRDLHIYIQTNQTNVESISIVDSLGTVGGGFANFNLSDAMDALLDDISEGDRFIIAFGFPVTAQALEGKLTTPSPDFDAQIRLITITAEAIAVHGKLTTPSPDFTAQLTVENAPAGAISVYGKLTVPAPTAGVDPFIVDHNVPIYSKLTIPTPTFHGEFTIEIVPADAITVYGKLSVPSVDFNGELTIVDILIPVYGKLTTPAPDFDSTISVQDPVAASQTRIGNRILEITHTVGLGTYTLGGSPNSLYQTFVDGISEAVGGNSPWERIMYHATDGKDHEIGFGTLANNTITRYEIIESTNDNDPVSWKAGAKRITSGLTAQYMNALNGSDLILTNYTKEFAHIEQKSKRFVLDGVFSDYYQTFKTGIDRLGITISTTLANVSYLATDGINYEFGKGTFFPDSYDQPELSRIVIYESSNNDLLVSWKPGSKIIVTSALSSNEALAHGPADKKLGALAHETTNTKGTGDYSLNGVKTSLHRTFVNAVKKFSNDETGPWDDVYYYVTNGNEHEMGYGELTEANPSTITRGTIIESTNNNNAVSWDEGTKEIISILPATVINDF